MASILALDQGITLLARHSVRCKNSCQSKGTTTTDSYNSLRRVSCRRELPSSAMEELEAGKPNQQRSSSQRSALTRIGIDENADLGGHTFVVPQGSAKRFMTDDSLAWSERIVDHGPRSRIKCVIGNSASRACSTTELACWTIRLRSGLKLPGEQNTRREPTCMKASTNACRKPVGVQIILLKKPTCHNVST